jgi:hypothetical protein
MSIPQESGRSEGLCHSRHLGQSWSGHGHLTLNQRVQGSPRQHISSVESAPQQPSLENLRISSVRSRSLCKTEVPIGGLQLVMAQEITCRGFGLGLPRSRRWRPHQVQDHGLTKRLLSLRQTASWIASPESGAPAHLGVGAPSSMLAAPEQNDASRADPTTAGRAIISRRPISEVLSPKTKGIAARYPLHVGSCPT